MYYLRRLFIPLMGAFLLTSAVAQIGDKSMKLQTPEYMTPGNRSNHEEKENPDKELYKEMQKMRMPIQRYEEYEALKIT